MADPVFLFRVHRVTVAFATTHPGLEPILAAELVRLGLSPTAIEPGGVEFAADSRALAAANVGLRTAGRVTLRIASFRAASFHELERHSRKVPWGRFLGPGVSVHLRATATKSKLYHEGAVIQRLHEGLRAVCPKAELVPARGEIDHEERASVFDLTPIQRFIVRLHRDECVISVDSSGPLLHRRGYRTDSAKAPLRETLAAALLLAAGWDGTSPLVDPMCGSGTIPIEAALLARRIPPGLRRRFAFELWPETDPLILERIRAELAAQVLDRAPVPILGSDRDAGAIRAASTNASAAGVSADILLRQGALSTLSPPVGKPGWVVTNPPYGHRIRGGTDLRNLYAQLGNVLRRNAAEWSIAMVSANRALEGQTGLRWRDLAETSNGGLRIRFVAAAIGTDR